MGKEVLELVANHGLNIKQYAFVMAYLQDPNGKQAAIKAGYAAGSAEVAASRLLTMDKVKAFIQSIQSKAAEKAGVHREKVLNQYARLAFFDIRKMYDERGQFKPLTEMDEDTVAAITGMEIEQTIKFEEDPDDPLGLCEAPKVIKTVTQIKKIKFADMKGALDSICKMEGYNTPEAIVTHGKVETVVTFKRG